MTHQEQMQKVVELQKLFPKLGGNLRPKIREVYTHQVATLSFGVSFPINHIDRRPVVHALEDLKCHIQNLIDDEPEEVSDVDGTEGNSSVSKPTVRSIQQRRRDNDSV